MSAQDFATLDRWAASLRQLPKMVERSAELVAEPARAAMAAPLAQGTSPDGEAWEPKKDGGKPYANAAAALTVRTAGGKVIFSITGPEYFGHIGARGRPRRRMLPRTTPPAVALAIRNRLAQEFHRIMGAR